MAQTDNTSGVPRRRGAAALRGVGFALAIALGALAIWMIATGDTVKTQRIGALAGMWGVLVGAYAVFGARRHDAQGDPGSALQLRQDAALARSEDVASQREFQARLEALLRREVQEGVSREIAGLRNEVSSLRGEILEKVGGQLRMERTETTRLFGSNLEALQREVHQLKVRQLGDTGTIDAIDEPPYRVDAQRGQTVDAEEIVDAPPQSRPPASNIPPVPPPAFPPFRPLEPMRAFSGREEAPEAEPTPPEPTPEPMAAESKPSGPLLTFTPATPAPTPAFSDAAPAQTPPVQPAAATLEPVPATPPTPAFVPVQPAPAPAVSPPPPTPAFEAAPEPPVASEPPVAPEPPVASEPRVASEPPLVPTPTQTPTPAQATDDPFASMPRIRPFTDFELDTVERPPVQADWPPPQWRGDSSAAASASRLSGRHATAAAPVPESTGGRRRRADDSENDVLARILEREHRPAGEDG